VNSISKGRRFEDDTRDYTDILSRGCSGEAGGGDEREDLVAMGGRVSKCSDRLDTFSGAWRKDEGLDGKRRSVSRRQRSGNHVSGPSRVAAISTYSRGEFHICYVGCQ